MTSPEDIQLPRASFEVYSSMIVGFLLAHADENSITTKELAAVTGRHPVMISQNTKSMVFLGIIEEGDNRGYR